MTKMGIKMHRHPQIAHYCLLDRRFSHAYMDTWRFYEGFTVMRPEVGSYFVMYGAPLSSTVNEQKFTTGKIVAVNTVYNKTSTTYYIKTAGEAVYTLTVRNEALTCANIFKI